MRNIQKFIAIYNESITNWNDNIVELNNLKGRYDFLIGRKSYDNQLINKHEQQQIAMFSTKATVDFQEIILGKNLFYSPTIEMDTIIQTIYIAIPINRKTFKHDYHDEFNLV